MITVHSAIVNNSWDSNPIHFKEGDLRVKRSRCRRVILSARSVILSAAQDLSPDSDPSLPLRMTKRDGLFFEMHWRQAPPLHFIGFPSDSGNVMVGLSPTQPPRSACPPPAPLF